MSRYSVVLALFMFVSSLSAQEEIRLWQNTNVRAHSVTLTPYLTDSVNSDGIKRNGIAVVVCPGGSYFWHDRDTEGRGVAEWLQRNGISAFVLNYRTAGIFGFVTHYRYLFRGRRFPDAQHDLSRALSYIRQNATSFGVDSSKVGAMGFSAGGHLVVSVSELEGFVSPNFVASIYPVVTMSHNSVHKRSRRALMGEWGRRNKKMRDSLSLEKNVRESMPPVFLVNCKDDPVVDYRNSELLDSALTAMSVSHLYLQYQTGGHGFGASDVKGTSECRQWRIKFLEWLHSIFPFKN